ncbi:thiamine pyrophosphate-binding protein [Lysinibacter sp. HNR]|uniref:thiamine pyrophosphate-binding protein n=1 Tax=Lysinibacter sp. HNR TaxID=3031408 RepID=UPI0024358C01|nr:thiamine pyrophosphate-binding protein [Lysinibacter sp. HNR]WGD37667.1 thiamine pyrophosphate-binding protein [Lysinibacter sp. HNR]
MIKNPDDGIRIGGDVVLETLWALGARSVVGLPGQHALGLFDALRRSRLRFLGARVENNAGFMADGLARVSGTVSPLMLSTGPGALTSLAALQEAASSSIPVLAISAQVPVAGLGGGRHGYLHELPDQAASFRGVVKSVFTVRNLAQIPSALAEAWRTSLTAPAGPTLVEIPQDVLLESAAGIVPPVRQIDVLPAHPVARPETIEAAAALLAEAVHPVILAGGGVVRAGAQAELRTLAETLEAPVVTTFGGKNALSWEHPLAARSWIEDIAVTEFLENADVLLVVGSGLGELSSNYHTFSPRGRVIQIEADLGKVNANHAGLGIHADAKQALHALNSELDSLSSASGEGAVANRQERRTNGRTRIDMLLNTVQRRLESQDLVTERDLIQELREAVPDGADTYWDMTILAYWAWSAWDPRDGDFASAQGAGGLGYGLPAAMGAALGHASAGSPQPVLAVSGDGGALYGVAELATLAQHRLNVTWLIIDDGGYGILREYMQDTFGEATATELSRPDYAALARSFGVDAERVSLVEAPAAVARALATPGPSVIVLPAVLKMFAPTHLDRSVAGPGSGNAS